MGVIGKLIGGTIGFALGGPIGAVAGAAFGHAFDNSPQTSWQEIPGRTAATASENAQLTFFLGAFSMLAKLARADGRISQAEVDSIENFMLHDLNLDPQSRQVAINIFHTAADSRESFESFATQFYSQFQNQPQLLELMVDILLRVATSDGGMTANEERYLESAVNIFRMGRDRYQALRARYVSDLDKHYAVLKLTPGASVAEIKKSYRQLVAEFHPDKIASKGLPEEFTRFATEKFQEIQTAYETISEERGIK